jgi:hypothetical protein
LVVLVVAATSEERAGRIARRAIELRCTRNESRAVVEPALGIGGTAVGSAPPGCGILRQVGVSSRSSTGALVTAAPAIVPFIANPLAPEARFGLARGA